MGAERSAAIALVPYSGARLVLWYPLEVRCALLALLLVLSACGDDSGMLDSGGPDASDAGDGNLVTPPTPPTPPTMTPCQPGWRESEADGLTYCEPWPEGGRADCSGSEAHLPGRPGCEDIGSACPADGWPADLPVSVQIRYVDGSATPDGDGTRSAPYATIAAAMSAVGSGDIIAVAVGSYPEIVSIRSGVTLIGACVSGVHLVPTDTNPRAGVVVVGGGGTSLRDVTVGPALRAGITLDRASSAIDLLSVAVVGVSGTGIRTTGGTITGARLIVRDTRPTVGDRGWGLVAEDGADVTLSDAVFENNRFAGIASFRARTVVRLTNSVVAGTSPTGGVFGRGIDVEAEGAVELLGVVLEDNTEYGLYVSNPGSSAIGSHIVARDTVSNSGGELGIGIASNDEGAMTFDRVFVDRSVDSAIVVDEGATLTLSDAILMGTVSGRDGYLGRGINIEDGSAVEITRVHLSGNSDVGIAARQSVLTATDVVVRDTRPRDRDDDYGLGMMVERGAEAMLSRVALLDNISGGLVGFDPGTVLVAEDLLIDGVTSSVSDGRFGRGMSLQEGVNADLTRVRIANVQDLGVIAYSEGTTIVARDFSVVGVAVRSCAATTCSDEPFGSGVVSTDRATITLERFDVADGALCGLYLVGDGTIDLEAGRIAGWPIGACIQNDGFDEARLSNRVRYVDNETNLQTTELPTPELGTPSEAF